MKTLITASLLTAAGLCLGGCVTTSIVTPNGTKIDRTAVGTNLQVAKMMADLKADGSGSVSIEGYNADQATTTNALIVAMAKALAVSQQQAVPVVSAAAIAK